MRQTINTVVFDLGGVLIDWDPRYLYRKIFTDEHDMEYFLSEICTPDWNEQQDAGRLLKEATSDLANRYPQFRLEIEAYYGRWEEMLGGAIKPAVNLLQETAAMKHLRVFALTNWSSETFPIAIERYTFLSLFEDIIVSGEEKVKKPDRKIFEILIGRTGLSPARTLFIDDSARNVRAAEKMGFRVIQFTSPKTTEQIRTVLTRG